MVLCLLPYVALAGVVVNWSLTGTPLNSAVNGQHLAWCCGMVSNRNESWYIFAPPSEGGNITSEAQRLGADHRDIGVILDDFYLQNQTVQSRLLSVVPQRFGENVCPVVSGAALLSGVGSNVPDTRCAVIVVEPYAGFGMQENLLLMGSYGTPSQQQAEKSGMANTTSVNEWMSIIGSMVSYEGGGKSIFILIYDHPYSGWTLPIPANYIIAGREYAESHNLGLIIWT